MWIRGQIVESHYLTVEEDGKKNYVSMLVIVDADDRENKYLAQVVRDKYRLYEAGTVITFEIEKLINKEGVIVLQLLDKCDN